MPIATLKFNLPEEKSEYDLAIKGGDYYSALWEIDQRCRSITKYGEKIDVYELCDEIRNMIPNLEE